MAFSWDNIKKIAIEIKIRRAKTMALAGSNPDFKLAHPDWVRDAQTKNYVSLIKKVTEQVKSQQEVHARRQAKLSGKNG